MYILAAGRTTARPSRVIVVTTPRPSLALGVRRTSPRDSKRLICSVNRLGRETAARDRSLILAEPLADLASVSKTKKSTRKMPCAFLRLRSNLSRRRVDDSRNCSQHRRSRSPNPGKCCAGGSASVSLTAGDGIEPGSRSTDETAAAFTAAAEQLAVTHPHRPAN
jgi:hypothetical protein